MADGLFGTGAAATPAATPSEAAPKVVRRTQLYPYDSVASQLFEPYGESAFDTLSLQQLWEAAARGNRKAAYHSHLCANLDNDAWHVGAGISLTAAALLCSIKHFRSTEMKTLIKEQWYDAVEQELTNLKPHLKMLNLGKGSAKQKDTGSFRQAKKRKTDSVGGDGRLPSVEEVTKAAKVLYDWLKQPSSPFRSLLCVLSGSNTYFSGHVAETVARAAVLQKPLTAEQFLEAMRARLGRGPQSEPASTASASSASGLFTLRILPSLLPVLNMAGAAVGLTNLGRSCFINAGLQNLLSIEDLKNAFASCRTATGEAVTEVIRRMQASSTAVAPTPITNVHYGGRQEDLTEFVLTLLNDCPSCHPLLRGREVAALRCKHCGFERALPSEEFLCLQLPIDGIHSVETALDRYRNRIQEQEDVEEWCCPQFGCLEGDLALDNPLRVTSIQEWPSVLVLTLKRWRWRGAVVMLDHEEAGNVKQAVAALAATVPRLSVQDRNAPAYLSPSTIRNWVQNHMHLYHTIQTLLEVHLLKNAESLKKVGLERILHWSLRFEFQARGTLHVHVLLWAELLTGWTAPDLTARSGESTSPFLNLLETLFHCRGDVQCGDGSHCLMRYVAGYVAKASDALQFVAKANRDDNTNWRQAYRLLSKRSPTEQEMTMEFAGLPMVRHSFSGVDVYAPIPGSQAVNASRSMYNTFQHHLTTELGSLGCSKNLTFIQWLRKYQPVRPGEDDHTVQVRNSSGPMKDKVCGVAISFPFELLDIYLGAWAAACLPGMRQARLLPEVPASLTLPGFEMELRRRRAFRSPDMCQHLKAVLCLDEFQTEGADPAVFNPDLSKLFARLQPELELRGLNDDRIATFKAKVQATHLLLLQIRDGHEDAAYCMVGAGVARSTTQAVVSGAPGTGKTEVVIAAANLALADQCRVLIAGPIGLLVAMYRLRAPGTGKTEVVIAAANLALADQCRVLIAGPIGLLVAMYRLRLPASANLTMETIHTAFKITREADKVYIPPGRLRRYDVIIFDEVSQIDADVWSELKVALGELQPGPVVIFVGDFQQLQPVHGLAQLQLDLEAQVRLGQVDHVVLQPHNMARSVDPEMLSFLHAVRTEQPSRQTLTSFFTGRTWSSDAPSAVRQALEVEQATGRPFTFWTVTNKGAHRFNQVRLAQQFPEAASRLHEGAGIPAETGNIVIVEDMNVRLTYNVNKDDGFVNVNTGTVRLVLRPDVFVMESDQQTAVLVYPITLRGRKFLPVSYGYATTMRRAQGVVLIEKDCTMGSGHCGGGIRKEAAAEYIAGASPDFVEALQLLAAEPDIRLAVATNSDPVEYDLPGQSRETHILGPDLAAALIGHWCPQALPKFEAMVGFDPSLPEHADEPMLPGKTWHMRRIAELTGVPAKKMVLFDDAARNLETDDGWRGVLVRDGRVGFQFKDAFAYSGVQEDRLSL
eukprot:s2340_g4.t2